MNETGLVAVPQQTKRFLESPAAQERLLSVAESTVTPLAMARIVFGAMSKNEDLAKCTKESILRGLCEGASMGLEVSGPRQESYLVPYKGVAALQVSWRGLIKLAIETERVAILYSEHVYENDEFQVQMGTNKQIVHVPKIDGDRGRHTHTYAVVKYLNGEIDFEVMTKKELDAVKARAKSTRGPWSTDEMEMHRKTPMKRLCKRIPQTDRLAQALEMDSQQERPAEVIATVTSGTRAASLAARFAESEEEAPQEASVAASEPAPDPEVREEEKTPSASSTEPEEPSSGVPEVHLEIAELCAGAKVQLEDLEAYLKKPYAKWTKKATENVTKSLKKVINGSAVEKEFPGLGGGK